jgi:hypothetical protein
MILMSNKAFPTLTPAHQHKALAALHEITTPESVGALDSETIDKEGIATLQYACLLAGYPDWKWNVSLATLPGEEPTVLEAELLPHEGALLAPEYLEAQKLAAESGIEVDEELSETLIELSEGSLDGVDFDDDIEAIDEDDDIDEDSLEEDLDEEDDLDDDEDVEDDDDEVADLSLITHSGDIDGVDIDILDESSEED